MTLTLVIANKSLINNLSSYKSSFYLNRTRKRDNLLLQMDEQTENVRKRKIHD